MRRPGRTVPAAVPKAIAREPRSPPRPAKPDNEGKMKIVLAEKVSPATLAVFQSESDWQVITHDQVKDGLAKELANADGLAVRSAVQGDDALMEASPQP